MSVARAAVTSGITQKPKEGTRLGFGIHGMLRGLLQMTAESLPATPGSTYPREFLELHGHSITFCMNRAQGVHAVAPMGHTQ